MCKCHGYRTTDSGRITKCPNEGVVEVRDIVGLCYELCRECADAAIAKGHAQETMTVMTIRELANTAIDKNDAQAAALLSDVLRAKGYRYADVLAFVRRSRPSVTDAQWEDLMEAADASE